MNYIQFLNVEIVKLINMKFICILFLSLLSVKAQIENPVTWDFKSSETDAKVGQVVEVIFTADIQKDWYVYSTGKYESAPSTTFTFEKNPTFELIGDIKVPKAKHKNDPYIGEYDYVTDKAIFVQKIKILTKNPIIKGVLEFCTCSQESGMCLPPKEVNFEFNITVSEPPKLQPLKVDSSNIDKKTDKKTNINDLKTIKSDSLVLKSSNVANQNINATTIQSTITTDKSSESDSLWGFFLLAFLSGLAALVTPCVFPMIPMTVTFFLNASTSKRDGRIKAIVYAISIILIYSTLGVLVAKLAGAEAANFISTHWIPNLFFFVVFIAFALSFLGLYEISLPSSIVNAVDKQSEKGGYLGVFFMAFTLALVSFSCTGPIVGNVLVLSANGDFAKPIVGMFGFSLAFAIPFMLFAMFPNWLKNLPKSGGWLNSVKVVLGFLELALALKFLSLADQAYHWNIMPRDINISIWIAIFSMIGLYLLHKIKLPHDDENYLTQKIGVFKIILAIFSFSFAIYLVPGLFGAPLKPLSGYLPPQKSTDFGQKIAISNENSLLNSSCESPKYADFLELPHGIKGYFDYKQALSCAKLTGKPVFIDFTGHGCVNCREMEANIWANPDILTKLKNDFIVVALYVDDKTELPENQWYTSKNDGKLKKTIGKQNADFQITNFKTNAQPYYVIVDANGNILNQPMAYSTNIDSFLDFLSAKKNNQP